jgi:hypothetical protein
LSHCGAAEGERGAEKNELHEPFLLMSAASIPAALDTNTYETNSFHVAEGLQACPSLSRA